MPSTTSQVQAADASTARHGGKAHKASATGPGDADSLRLPKTLPTLYPGCRYKGFQTSEDRSYEVEVSVKDIDLDKSYVCGDLLIRGLTPEHPVLETFFEGEIIGDKHGFVTDKWGSTRRIDFTHWEKFAPFAPYMDQFDNRKFVYDVAKGDHIFMRWKEQFVVQPTISDADIKGASFAGFYYICWSKQGSIEGYYFHAASEMFQRLSLKFQPERKFGTYEFR